MTKLTLKNNKKSIPKNQSLRKKVGGTDFIVTYLVYSNLINALNIFNINRITSNEIRNLEKQLDKMKIEMDKNKPLHLKVYDGIIKLFEKYPKLLTALGAMLTPALIYKLSKNLLGTKVTKISSPPKSIVKLMKMYLKRAS